jgi:hypothetical protein
MRAAIDCALEAFCPCPLHGPAISGSIGPFDIAEQ